VIGIVIPAHDEEHDIAACLLAARVASEHPDLGGERVEICVVCDLCSDGTEALARLSGATTLAIHARNVGRARAAGADALMARGARWLAFTDADSRVEPAWLVNQLALTADAVCGTVQIDDWTPHGAHAGLIQWHFGQTYHDEDGHRHIHGANLGVSAQAYRRCGGFQGLACNEDHALVHALQACGAHVVWSAKPRVITSARTHARATGGFADALCHAVNERLAAGPLAEPASQAPLPG
jgi:glycosyltransferase involved in cell wall biosynthesis